jgi:hypothetical protein
MNTLRALRRYALTLLAFIALGGAAYAQPNAPTASAVVDGGYTVTFDPTCDAVLLPGFYCEFVYLLEQAGTDGPWSVVSAGAGTVTFTSKLPGSYTYVVWMGVSSPYYGMYFEGYSPATTVVVPSVLTAAPVRDDILTQLTYQYDVRSGDIDGDGRADLFVRKAAGGSPLNGTVEETILQQTSAGYFDAIVPTAGQAAAASAWPLAPTVQPRLHDIDVDGYVDVTLFNVASVVNGAADQIVFSPGALAQAQPGGVRAVDAGLKNFVGDAMDYFYDPNYFLKNAPMYFYQSYFWYAYCPHLGIGGIDVYYWQAFTYCYIDYVYYFGIYLDYSAFSQDAVQLWTYEYYGENEWLSKEQAMSGIETIIESVIQAPIGGWPMEELLGQIGPQTEPILRRGLEAVQAILNAARAVPEHVDMDNLPPQTPRAPDVIHVTGHRLWPTYKAHLALEYASPQTVGGLYMPTILSGEAENWPPVACFPWMQYSFCGWGKLLAGTNRPTDHWYLNFTVGHVIPFVGVPGAYWNNSLVPRHNRYVNVPYVSKLNYNALPDAASNTYNSNGYARGLNGQGGFFVVPPDMNSVYPGWDRPVPDALFQ